MPSAMFSPSAGDMLKQYSGRGDVSTRLLVIGHARSGTTVLLNALNTCRDIYLLGEPFTFRDGGVAGFRQRFNDKHRRYGNQPTKSAYAPALPGLAEDADGAA